MSAFFGIGRPDDSYAHLPKALESNPTYPEAHNNLGNTLLEMGRAEEAIAHYRKAVEIQPRNTDAYNNLGAVFLQLGRVEESLAYLQKALEIDPDSGEAQNNLGNTLLRMGRMDEAAAHYGKALEIEPASVNAQNNLAWLLATSSDAWLRNGAKAVELAEQADQLTKNKNPVIGATLAAAYAEAGRFPEAVKTARRALNLATASGNRVLADAIHAQIELYQAGSPSRETPKVP